VDIEISCDWGEHNSVTIKTEQGRLLDYTKVLDETDTFGLSIPNPKSCVIARVTKSDAATQGVRMTVDNVLYTAKVHTTGSREGSSNSSDGRLEVKLSNPGQLFAAGWSACFLSAMKVVAGEMKIALPADTAVDAEVDLVTEGGGYSLAARMNISAPGLAREVAEAIVAAAH
jgi:osmotically inducible protein OsmC